MVAITNCKVCQRCLPGLSETTYHNSISTDSGCYIGQQRALFLLTPCSLVKSSRTAFTLPAVFRA